MFYARYIFEAFGADVQWDEKTKTINGNDKEVKLKINDNTAYVNSEAVNGRTLIPLRFVVESFNAEVNWDQATKTVSIRH